MTAEAMTPASISDLIAEIRARHKRCDNSGSTWTHDRVAHELKLAHEDRAKLLDALQASQPCCTAAEKPLAVQVYEDRNGPIDNTYRVEPCGAAGDVTRQLTDLIRDMKLEHRQSAEIADAVLALLRSQPTAQGWSIPLGTPIKYRVGGKYPEWERGGPYYFAGINVSHSAAKLGQPRLWVAEKWPIEHGGHLTDDFDPDEWEVAQVKP